METPNTAPASTQQDAMRKATLLQAVSQLEMLVLAFAGAPDRVRAAAEEFKAALQEWAES